MPPFWPCLAPGGGGGGSLTSVTSYSTFVKAETAGAAVVLAGSINAITDAANWPSRAAWEVNFAAGNDVTNTGAPGSPLATLTEFFNRLGASAGQNVTITISGGNQAASDKPTCWYVPAPNNNLSIVGTPTIVYSSAVTTYTSATSANNAPNTTECDVVDNAVPGGSWTAAGALVSGRVIRQTTGGKTLYAHPLEDRGANTLQVAWPSPDGNTFATGLANGVAYDLIQLPIVRDIAVIFPFTWAGTPSLKISLCDMNLLAPTAWFQFTNCTQSTGLLVPGGSFYFNCGLNVVGGIFFNATGSSTTLLLGGCCRGNAAGTRRYFFQNGLQARITGPFVNHKSALILSGGAFMLVQASGDGVAGVFSYGVAAAALQASYWSTWLWFSGVTAGARNTGPILQAFRWSQFANASGGTLTGPGQTSADPNPWTIGATPVPVGNYPPTTQADGNCIFATV